MPDRRLPIFESPTARAALERPAPHVLLLTMSGAIGREMAIEIGRALSETLAEGGQSFTFWDLEHLEQYDSRLRIDCTQALRNHWAKVKGITVLARSPLVRMGVSVANLALDNRIDAHANRGSWQRRFEVALKAVT